MCSQNDVDIVFLSCPCVFYLFILLPFPASLLHLVTVWCLLVWFYFRVTEFASCCPWYFLKWKYMRAQSFVFSLDPPFRSICIPFLNVSDSPLSFKPSTIPQSPIAPIPPQFHTSKVICHPCLPLINSVIGCPLIGSSFHSHIRTHVHTHMHKSSY